MRRCGNSDYGTDFGGPSEFLAMSGDGLDRDG